MIEGLIKTLANLIGKKISTKVSDKQSLKDADLSKDFEYTMKNVKMFLIAGIISVLIGVGLIVMFIVSFEGIDALNSDLIAGGSIGLAALAFGVGIIYNYSKYEVSYTNSYVAKKSITKKQEVKWEDVRHISVNKKNMIVLKTDSDELTIKPVVTGIHDFIYLLINMYGDDLVTILSQNQLTYKKLTETIKKYNNDKAA